MKQLETVKDTMLDKRRLDLDEKARWLMIEGTRQWIEGRDPAPSFRAAAACWREAGDYGSLLRADLADREAEKG